MGKFNTLLNLRLKQKTPEKEKMTALAELSKNGQLTSFSGIFRLTSLSESEKESIKTILLNFAQDTTEHLEEDFLSLVTLTSEVKAIANQAIILHGERIKKAQNILKKYKDGAFTTWLISTYGNRQTPYNFLQYYEFYMTMPPVLHPKIDRMPRQAIYTLASRPGDCEKKEEIVKNFNGETKQQLLSSIRTIFPLDQEDKRNPHVAAQVINSLKKIIQFSKHLHYNPTETEKKVILELLKKIETTL